MIINLYSSLRRWVTVPMLISFLFLISLPLWIKSVGLYQYLGVEILIWMIFALGFNLLLGYTGLPSFGHGAYFGIGAYSFGLVQHNLIVNVWVGLAGGILAASFAAALVALFISHKRGIYFALMTIAFGQIFWFIAVKCYSITGGEDGLLDIPRPDALFFSLESNTSLFYFSLFFFCIVVIGLWRLINSPFGKIIKAIKQNEMRAGFIGYNVRLYKFLVFVISGGISGLAGALFSMAQQSAYPDVMSLHVSGYVVMMTLIGGGFVSFWGPVLGTAVFFLARDILGAITHTWLLWYGLMFMAIVIFKPEGIAGIWQDLTARWAKKPTVAIPPEEEPNEHKTSV